MMKTIGLKQDSRTGARTDVMNIGSEDLEIMQEIIRMLFSILPKFVTRIFKLLLIEIAGDPASDVRKMLDS